MVVSMNGRTHAEMLPEIRAANEAWRREYLPKAHARQAAVNARRDRVTDLIQRGLDAIEADEPARAVVFAVTGIATALPVKKER